MTNTNKKFVAIDASVLGIKKPVMVLESNRNHIRATKMQLVMSSLSDKDFGEDYQGMLKAYSEVMEEEIKFLSETLGLTEKQVDEVYDLDQDETVALIMQVIGKLMHMNIDEVEPEDNKKEEN